MSSLISQGSGAGALDYMAPELAAQDFCTEKVDCCALRVVFIHLVLLVKFLIL